MLIGITERGDAALDTSWQNEKVDVYILVTKAPSMLPKDLPEKSVIHCVITGNGHTWLEPLVPPMAQELEAYHRLVGKYGPQRVVLRADPIVPQGEWWDRSFDVVRQAEGRLRISFIDAYEHARWRVKHAGYDEALIFPWKGFHAPLELRQQRLEEIRQATKRDVEMCGEPGLSTVGCSSARDLEAVGFPASEAPSPNPRRPACTCLTKQELLWRRKPRPCPHGCLYCYWRDW